MSEKEIFKEAFNQIENAKKQEKIEIVKQMITENLQRIERRKEEKERIEEELRILKLDLEDLKNGKFDKIQERIDKSVVARRISAYNQLMWPFNGMVDWPMITTGTYSIKTSDGRTKLFYF